jgi:hypothetical protein
MIPAITKDKLLRWANSAVIAVNIIFLFRGSAQADGVPRIVVEKDF